MTISRRIFLIDGTSGVWKEDVIHYIDHVLVDATVVRKVSTRHARKGENLELIDLELVARSTFTSLAPDYVYEYGGELYGISKSKIRSALRDYASVFVIVRNVEIIRRLRHDFKQFCPTSVFVYMDSKMVEQRARLDRSPEIRSSVKVAFDDYLRSPDDYDEIIVHGAAKNDLYRLLNLLISRAAARPDGWFKRDLGAGILVVTPAKYRRVAQVLFAFVITLCGAFVVNVVTSGVLDYWRMLAVVAVGALLVLCVALEGLLAWGWRELER